MNLGYLHLVISRCRGLTAPIRAAQLAVAFALLLAPVTAAASTAPSKNQAESGAKTTRSINHGTCGQLWTSAIRRIDRMPLGCAARCRAMGTPRTLCTCAFSCSTWTQQLRSGWTSGRAPTRASSPWAARPLPGRPGAPSNWCRAPAPYTLRGYVEFQWRRANKTVHEVARATSAGHTSLAGADPANFSAATCTLS